MIPIEILKRVGRKAQEVLNPTGPKRTTKSPATSTGSVENKTAPTNTSPGTSTGSVENKTAPHSKSPGTSTGSVENKTATYTQPGELADLGVLFMPLAEYHGRELGAVATALQELGHRSTFLVEEPLVNVVDKHLGDFPRIIAEKEYDRFALGTFDAFVAMNDWGEPSRAIYHLARTRGVPSFAKVEGVQDFTDVDTGRIRLPYMAADHVLVQGANDIEALDRKNLHTVGNANMETAWKEGPGASARSGEVAINSNFTYGVLLEARDEFLRGAITAILATELTPVISQHPVDRPLPGEFAQYRTDRSMSELLPVVDAVVTRFSTIPFEAIAYGTPFVYFNPHREKVPTFATPDPAFDHVHTAEELQASLTAAIGSRDGYRAIAEPYFRAQIDMTEEPSAMRSAAAIATVVYG